MDSRKKHESILTQQEAVATEEFLKKELDEVINEMSTDNQD